MKKPNGRPVSIRHYDTILCTSEHGVVKEKSVDTTRFESRNGMTSTTFLVKSQSRQQRNQFSVEKSLHPDGSCHSAKDETIGAQQVDMQSTGLVQCIYVFDIHHPNWVLVANPQHETAK